MVEYFIAAIISFILTAFVICSYLKRKRDRYEFAENLKKRYTDRIDKIRAKEVNIKNRRRKEKNVESISTGYSCDETIGSTSFSNSSDCSDSCSSSSDD